MNRTWNMTVVIAAVLASVTVVGLEGACNNVGDCPTKPITPNDPCSGDNLECPYTLDTPSPACDGTMVDGGLATSCTCTSGAWACPDPISCGGDDGGGDDGSAEAGDDAATDAADDTTASDDGGDGGDAALD